MKSVAPLTALLIFASAACAPSVYHDRDAELHRGERVEMAPIKFENSPLKLCATTRLNASMIWPQDYSPQNRDMLTLALNISGSFEGNSNWSTIANNFDGQGLSLGLLNQNLGTGSLQPLLIEMRDNHFGTMARVFSPDHLASLLGMLAQWQSEMQSVPSLLFFSFRDSASRLSEPAPISSQWLRAENANRRGVAWALEQVYGSDGRFKNDWRRQFTDLAASKEFVDLQTEAALTLDRGARQATRRLGLNSLTAYLLLFDFYVQDGGLFDADYRDWQSFSGTSPESSVVISAAAGSPTGTPADATVSRDESELLGRLLTLRLRHVKPEYRNDVFARKMAIIAGHGFVHGRDRHLEAEYCYDGRLKLNFRPDRSRLTAEQ